jgi:hypothetical protein
LFAIYLCIHYIAPLSILKYPCSTKYPVALTELIEREARNSAGWLQDNRLCVAADKSKLLICGTKQLRASKDPLEIRIEVEGQIIEESTSEKLLGVVLNNELTWKHQQLGSASVFC